MEDHRDEFPYRVRFKAKIGELQHGDVGNAQATISPASERRGRDRFDHRSKSFPGSRRESWIICRAYATSTAVTMVESL